MARARIIPSVLACLALGGAAFAQAPQGAGSSYDDNRIPVTSGAGVGSVMPPISSFPAPNGGVVGGSQGYQPPRPGLSPYLNLNRGNNNRGLNAVDYYNFVRPAQQSLGSYVGRQQGPYSPQARYGGVNIDSDAQLDPDSQLRSAGSPSSFMTAGRYFNSMGSIGIGARPPQQTQQQQRSTMGRRY